MDVRTRSLSALSDGGDEPPPTEGGIGLGVVTVHGGDEGGSQERPGLGDDVHNDPGRELTRLPERPTEHPTRDTVALTIHPGGVPRPSRGRPR